MSIKLIALDLDNTLITKTTDFSEKDLAAIEKAREAGIYVTLASGRAYRSLKIFLDRLKMDTYSISTGGAIVSDQNNKRLYTKFVEPKTAADIIRFAYDNDYYAQVYLNDDFVFFKEGKESAMYEKATSVPGIFDETLVQQTEIETPKVLFIDEPARIEALIPIIESRFPNVKAARSFPEYLEINHTDCGKGSALAALGDMLGFKQEEMMAIGDSEIDVSMIKYAGIGVAMGNAPEHIQKVADYVTLDVLESGVAHAIEKFCF
ncbi:MAG: Cof-type HAD-IIB family hydrolase [Eubacteriales bacterium]